MQRTTNKGLAAKSVITLWCFMALVACTKTVSDPPSDALSDACDNGNTNCHSLPDVGDDVGETIEVGQYPIHLIDIIIAQSELDALTEETTEEITVQVDLSLNGQTFSNVDFELHGGFAKGVPKKSFRIELPDDLDIYPNLFGDGPEKQRRFVLLGSWIDPTFLRHKLSMDLIRESGGLSPRVSYVRLSFNGEYYGLLQLVERIDKLYLDRQGWRKSGNLYKAENHNANWQSKSNPLKGYDHQEGEDNSTDDLGNLLDALSNTPATHADFAANVEPILHLENFMVWQRALTFAMDQDSYTKNYYLYHDVKALPGESEDQFRVVGWDADATWGISWDGETVDATESDWYGTDAFSPRLFSIDHYRDTYLSDYEDALDTIFSVDSLHENVDQWTTIISAEAKEDLEKWEQDVDFDSEIENLKTVMEQRHTTMDAAISAL